MTSLLAVPCTCGHSLAAHSSRRCRWPGCQCEQHEPAPSASAATEESPERDLRPNPKSIDGTDAIRLRLLISKLEAKLALTEIEAVALTHEIASPLTPDDRRDEATAHRDGALSAANALRAELDTLRHSFPDLACH